MILSMILTRGKGSEINEDMVNQSNLLFSNLIVSFLSQKEKKNLFK